MGTVIVSTVGALVGAALGAFATWLVARQQLRASAEESMLERRQDVYLIVLTMSESAIQSVKQVAASNNDDDGLKQLGLVLADMPGLLVRVTAHGSSEVVELLYNLEAFLRSLQSELRQRSEASAAPESADVSKRVKEIQEEGTTNTQIASWIDAVSYSATQAINRVRTELGNLPLDESLLETVRSMRVQPPMSAVEMEKYFDQFRSKHST